MPALDGAGSSRVLLAAVSNRAPRLPSVSRATPVTNPLHGAILELQRTAGNRAVAGLLSQGQVAVQRVLATKPSDLDKFISTVDLVKGGIGKASEHKKGFNAIRSALSEYQSEVKSRTDPEMQARRLAILDVLCTRFLKDNPGDIKRRAIIDRLLDEIGYERAAVSQVQGQEIYQGNIASSSPGSGVPVSSEETDPAKKFAFQALSQEGQQGATNYDIGERRDRRQKVEEEKAKYGLSEAEISAITIFSAGDFKYINPAVANSPKWLASNKAKAIEDAKGGTPDRFTGADDKTIMQEGSLHTAVAMQGLAKMERYEGESYRGARYTPEEFKDKFAVGGKTKFTTLASSSHSKDIALDFAHGTGTGTKPKPEQTVAVLSILTGSGGVDISNIAMIRSEAEVLILPGSFKVISVEEVDGNVEYASWIQSARNDKQPLPTKWYVARLSPTEADPAPTKPAPKWAAASATGPKLPMTTPIDEYLRKAGKPSRSNAGGHR